MYSAAFDAAMARQNRPNQTTLDRKLRSGDWISQQNKVFPDLREYCQIQRIYWEGSTLRIKLPQFMQLPGRSDDVCKLQPDPTPGSKGYLDESLGVHLTLMLSDFELVPDDGEVCPVKPTTKKKTDSTATATATKQKKAQQTEPTKKQSKELEDTNKKQKGKGKISASSQSSVVTLLQSGSDDSVDLVSVNTSSQVSDKKRKVHTATESLSRSQSHSQTDSLVSLSQSADINGETILKKTKTSNSQSSGQSKSSGQSIVSSSRRAGGKGGGSGCEELRNKVSAILVDRKDLVMDEADPYQTLIDLYKYAWVESEKTAAKIDFASLFASNLDHSDYPVDDIRRAFDQLFGIRLEQAPKSRTQLIAALTFHFLSVYESH